MGAKITTKYLDETEYDAWDLFVSKSPDGSIYSTAAYLEILCQAGGGNFKILAAMQGDDMVGGIGLYENRGHFGTFVASRLLLYYNGLVLQDYDTKYPSQRTSRHLKIMVAIEEALAAARYGSIQFKNRSTIKDIRVFLASGWSARLTYTYVVDCTDISAMWGRIEQNLRRLINRCTEGGMQFSEDDDFESLYRLHAQTHERKKSPLYLPHDQFKRYFERLLALKLCRLYNARLADGQAISSLLVLLGSHAVSHSVCAGTDEDAISTGASVFLRWRALQNIAQLGYAANDLTDAALNPVTRFKSQLGAELQSCLVVYRPEAFAFRFVNFATHFNSTLRTGGVNLVRKLLGRAKNTEHFSYWQ